MSGEADPRPRDALFRAGFELTSDLSPAAVMTRIVDLGCHIADAAHGSLVVLGAGGRVAGVVTSGVAEERRRLDRAAADQGVLGEVLRSGRALRRDGMADDPGLVGLPRSMKPASFLGAPIVVRGEVFGALCLVRDSERDPFDDGDEEAVTFFAGHAGVALHNAHLLREAEVRARALRGANEVRQAVLAGRDTDEVLSRVARWARELVGASLASVATPVEGSDSMVVRVADGEQADRVAGMVFPVTGSISGEVMREGRPVLVEDASSDPRTDGPVGVVGGMGPALFVPLAVGDRILGTVSVADRAGRRRFSEEDLLVVRTFALEAAVALQYGHISSDLARLSLLDERERIAMELHDGVIQALFVVGLSLQAAEAVVDDPDEVRRRLADAVGSIDRAIRDLRNYIFGLQPGSLADRELARDLRDLAESFERSGRVSTSVHVDPRAASVLAPRSADILQAAREAMSNAVRHSGAGHIALRFSLDGAEAVLEVDDDGSGFDLRRAAGLGSGLANLGSRAESLGGVLEMASVLGQGTTVRLRIPL